MEFNYQLCVAVILLLGASARVSSQPADPASPPAEEARKMMDMIYRQLRDTGPIMTDIKTLIMLQMQHSRDVTKANNDFQSQYDSAMAAMNSQINSLTQQLNETRAAMNSQFISLAQQQNETQATMNSQNIALSQQQNEAPKAASEACAGSITGPTTMLVDSQPITAPCDGQGWIVIQRRVNNDFNFPNRTWQDYKHGFGDLAGSFWLGLEYMHRLTNRHRAVLRVDLEDWKRNSRWAQYSFMRVEGESDQYRLRLGNYSGTAGDSLGFNNNSMFCTRDRDNDGYSNQNLAADYGGAWWFEHYAVCCLNGEYVPGGASDRSQGIYWAGWKDSSYSYKRALMKLFIIP